MLYKRSEKPGAVYWTRFTLRGREIRVSTGTNRKTLAEEFEKQLRDQIWREQQLGEIAYTWDDATVRWLEERAGKRSLDRDKLAFKSVGVILNGMFIADISDGTIEQIIKLLRGQGRAPSGINRDLACVRSVLNRARRKWKWEFTVPVIEPLETADAPPRWERPEKIAKLQRELPEHARDIAEFGAATGLRSKNIFRLRWVNVDMEKRCCWVESSEHKSRRSVGIPLNDAAMAVLERRKGNHPVYVFTDHLGRAPITSIKTCWKKACLRAGLPGFRPHDLRHTWVAWHKLRGTPERAIKELGGWVSMDMLERYGHINPTDFAAFADNSPTKNGTRKKRK